MNWYVLKKLADYADHYDRIEDLASENSYPFSSWFDENGRTYIPFNPVGETQGFDKWVGEVVADQGCEITDYRGGYCQCGNRTFRIGKLIQKAQKEAIAELDRKMQAGDIYDYERELASVNKFYMETMNEFINSSYRVGKGFGNEMEIVISQNPHDVASMSTDKNWTSCMELGEGKGSHQDQVYCEVQSGGLVAYLIMAKDQNIENPMARIHIRRFDNRRGQSVAVQEGSVYGNEVEGFEEIVRTWLNQKQDIRPGMYERQGGSYSDTFSKNQLFGPDKPEDILAWYRGEGEDAQYSTWTVVDEMFREVKQVNPDGAYENEEDMTGIYIEDYEKKFNTKEEAETYFQEISNKDLGYEREDMPNMLGEPEWEEDDWAAIDEESGEWVRDRFKVLEVPTDHRADMKSQATKAIIKAPKGTYSEEVILEVKKDIWDQNYTGDQLKRDFIKKYPEYVDEVEAANMNDSDSMAFINALPEEKRGPYKERWLESINDQLEDPASFVSIGQHAIESAKSKEHLVNTKLHDKAWWDIHIAFDNSIYVPIRDMFDRISETTIRGLVSLPGKIEASGLPAVDSEGNDGSLNLIRRIIWCLEGTNSDTPTVQNFYESLLPRWNHEPGKTTGKNFMGVEDLGRAIGKLGENGQKFLPFIQQKVNEEQAYMDSLQGEKKELESQGNGTKVYNLDIDIKMQKSNLEKHLYIIDSLQNKTGYSDKYRFYSNWYRAVKKA